MKLSRTAPSHFVNEEFVLNPIDRKLLGTSDRMGNLNQHMFRDEFKNIFVGSSRRNAAVFEVTSNDDDIQKELLSALNLAARHSRGQDSFQEVLEGVTQSLLYYGKAAYFLHNEESNEPVFRPLQANTVFKVFGVLFQYLPKRTVRNWDSDDTKLGREVRFLNRRQVLFFSWPKSVRKKIDAQNQVLKALDKYGYDVARHNLPQPTHENPAPKTNFDFSVWRDIQDNALYEATKFTGWSGRKSSQPNTSDFLSVTASFDFGNYSWSCVFTFWLRLANS